ncbi:MAG: hypothetical protein B6244_10050 [Candidatus Cloacimonetes bacterium 4572_55]|nr:MAG: hypothetical protein B6244_10050 [Candidatus Cloacimonetes bacterium 4572_55]
MSKVSLKKSILFILIILIGLTSYQVVQAIQDSNAFASLKMFSTVFSMVKDRYVDEVDSEDMIEDAIRGMLLDLDPHSNFLDVEQYSDMQEEHKGEFFGLGIQISVQEGILTVISPIFGTPAYEMGMHAGDRIVEIEGESTEGITTDKAVKKLRGPKGTQVTITISREGEAETFNLTITRDRIPIYSVPYHFMIRPSVGYVRVTRFAKNTLSELSEALVDLRNQGMTQLILDLRNNPGGYLNQAVDMADLFLDGDKTVVSTKGRIRGSSEEYKASRNDQYEDIAVIVVVNRGSASASEIVAGAIQDWDRGLVIGERTFGKGLVQRVWPLPPDHKRALKLTIAKYYTPSGRLIQRDYDKSRMDYYRERGEETGDTTDVKYTSHGREVTGGGGILPDISVEPDTLNALIRDCYRQRLFFKFAISYNATHGVDREWMPDSEALDQFKALLDEKEFEYEPDDFEANLDDIKLGIKREIFSAKFDQQAGMQIALEQDKQIMHAVHILEGSEVVNTELRTILEMNY